MLSKFLTGENYFESSKRPSCEALTRQLFGILESTPGIPRFHHKILRVPMNPTQSLAYEPRSGLKFFRQGGFRAGEFPKPTPKKGNVKTGSRKESEVTSRNDFSEEEKFSVFCEKVASSGRVDWLTYSNRARKQLFLNKIKKYFRQKQKKYIKIKASTCGYGQSNFF